MRNDSSVKSYKSIFKACMALLLSLMLLSCIGDGGSTNPAPLIPDTFYVSVKGSFPHDTTAYTQGYEVHNGVLWESTGLYGNSTLRKLDLSDGTVLETYPLPDSLFGEGITIVNSKIYQLTWRESLVLEWEIQNPVLTVSDSIETEGWGICAVSSSTVVTSDGSSTLSFRDVTTFDTLRTVDVNILGESINMLNELEYHEGYIYANRYYSYYIYRIDPGTGNVSALINASALQPASNSLATDVMNGIAWDPGREAFLLTGKKWPTVYIVTFQ
jgi:glutaminyl-peptide cyclotransferase